MKIAEFLPATHNRLWDLSAQMGIKFAICKCAPELTGLAAPDNLPALQVIQKRFQLAGFQLYGLEGDQFDMQRIKLGLPGREKDIERYFRMLENMGKLKIPLLCYNFMAGIGWHRSKADKQLRGKALSSHFDLCDVPDKLTEYGIVTAEAMWDNYQWFIERVIPVAEENGVRMGLHPDDPPIPELCGIARILNSPANIRHALSFSDSPNHGLTYCQANFQLLGDENRSILKDYKNRIVFVHFRDVEGTADNFYETFHDEGPTDMPGMIKMYQQIGFDGPIRVDHVPTMAGEDNSSPGYSQLGRLFAIGYLKGIMQTLDIPIE